MTDFRFLICSDHSITVEFSNEISEEVNKKVRFLSDKLQEKNSNRIFEWVPTFRSITIYFDSTRLSLDSFKKYIIKLMSEYNGADTKKSRVFIIPVCYDSSFGLDLVDLSLYSGLTIDEIIDIHSSKDYLIYMLGFLPGFAYLGGLDKRISMPRLKTPRLAIPSGSVGIGGEQTGVYPLESPGGWRLIGRTPVKLYNPKANDPILYRAGDYIRFKPITMEEYYMIEDQVKNNEWLPEYLEQ